MVASKHRLRSIYLETIVYGLSIKWKIFLRFRVICHRDWILLMYEKIVKHLISLSKKKNQLGFFTQEYTAPQTITAQDRIAIRRNRKKLKRRIR